MALTELQRAICQPVLLTSGDLCRDEPHRLGERLQAGQIGFHEGRIRGAIPSIFPD